MMDRDRLAALVARMRAMSIQSRQDSFGNCRAVATIVEQWADELSALLAAEGARPAYVDAERLAECLIALYGAAVSQGAKDVQHGAHPGEELSRQFVEAITAALRIRDQAGE